MEPKLGVEIECGAGCVVESKSMVSGRPELNGSNSMSDGYVPRIRRSEVNGFAVYTRTKRLKSRSEVVKGFRNEIQRNSGNLAEVVDSKGVIVVRGVNSATMGGVDRDSRNQREVMDVEVEDKRTASVIRCYVRRKFGRSVFRPKDDSKGENDNSGDLQDSVGLEEDKLDIEKTAALGGPKARKKETNMSKKIPIEGRPSTVRELFETGLLEGYPVFYNGGRRGFPLRGTIKDSGILCFCSLCKGARVVPLCKFEIHACKSYRRASQYICIDNGKSLLDVVKECQNSSLMTLEETIQKFIGPIPVKELVSCRNCKGSFHATSAAKGELLCDSCMIVVDSEINVGCVKSRSLEPLSGIEVPENGEMLGAPPGKGRQGRKKQRHIKLKSNTKSPGISSLQSPTSKKRHREITKMRLPRSSGPKSPETALVRKILTKLPSTTTLSKSIHSGFPAVTMQSKSSSKITKKDNRMHKLVFENGGLPDGTELIYYSNGKKSLDGYKMGAGIFCRCCSTLVSPSQFEAHAGWTTRRKPYMYIYTSNGVSLHELAIALLKGRKGSVEDNDDLCTICADGGKLVLCDGCPRAFHKECASLLSIPRGKWYCTYCQNKFQRESFVERNANAVAAGRLLGIDSITHITNRCIRTVKNPEEAEVIACIICRGYDFSKSGFGPRTVILCDQCEREYHVGCLKKCKIADLKELPKGKWLCSAYCKWIYSTLQNLLNSGAEKLPDDSLDIIKKKLVQNNFVADTDFDVRWRLLNGKVNSHETRVLLSQAVAIFHECFDPIVDSETGRDFIPSMVYGRNIRGQDFSGMYCAILTVNSTVVSTGILRIFGQNIAELPLAATRVGNQGKGYFQTLYNCIEKLLAFLNVKSFVVPATDASKSIWTEKFGFKKIPEEQLLEYRKTCWQMIAFKGTSMLEKPVPKCRIINQDQPDPDVPLE